MLSQWKWPASIALPPFSSIKKRKNKNTRWFGCKEVDQNAWGNLILFTLGIGNPSFSLTFGEEIIPHFPSSLCQNEACWLTMLFFWSHTEFPVRTLILGRELIRKQIYLYNGRENPYQLTKSLWPGSLVHEDHWPYEKNFQYERDQKKQKEKLTLRETDNPRNRGKFKAEFQLI